MAEKKKRAKKVKKGIGLFDHIKQVNQIQDPHYFDKLSKDDMSTWSNWMILRSLSYNPEYTDIVNELQKYLGISPRLMYKLMIGLFPIDRGFHPFITGKSKEKYQQELICLVKNHFQISESEAIDYLKIFYLSESNLSSLVDVVKMYGKTEKEIEKLIKI